MISINLVLMYYCTGKYHFKIYACCCATTWLAIGFKLHCASDIQVRLSDGGGDNGDGDEFIEEIQQSSTMRSLVLEVSRPIHGTKRIVNTDNFYTSVQLLEALRLKGLYGRGTCRENSKHFFKGIQISKKDNYARGVSFQAVCLEKKIIAASWVDANVVNIVSNADESTFVAVERRIKQNKVAFKAPKCVQEYNSGMQGVDRLDQLRARFSLSDGHSFKKWHLKLAMAFIDIARSNAFVTRKLALGEDGAKSRDLHRQFLLELTSELVSGEWKTAVNDEGLMYASLNDLPIPEATTTSTKPQSPINTDTSPTCQSIESKIAMQGKSRNSRNCKVCKIEGRKAKQNTVYCREHRVCLCMRPWPGEGTTACKESWTCWEKFHFYYLKENIFSAKGGVRRSSELYQSLKCKKPRLSQDNTPPTVTSYNSSQ